MNDFTNFNGEEFYKKCNQCPRDCNVNRIASLAEFSSNNNFGFCQESSSIKIASACLHFGEEPLITVFGGSGTIFFTGCTLRCAFCQNYQISQQGMGRAVSKEEFVKICLDLQNAGAENINLVTASHIIPKLAEYLYEARTSGVTVPFCWNSSAYEKIEMLELLKGLVTIWLPDLKTLNSDVSKNLFAARDYPEVSTKAIKWMIEQSPLVIDSKVGVDNQTGKKCTKEKMMSGVIIRHLFLPGHFEDTVKTLEWLKQNADKRAVISLMSQYTPVPFKESQEKNLARQKFLSILENRLVSTDEDNDLKDLIDIFDFEYLFYQDLCQDTEWLPDFTKIQPFSNKLAKPIWHWTKN